MNRHYGFVILLLIGIISVSCNLDDKYFEPCLGKYGSSKVLDSIKQQYRLNGNVWFREIHKDYLPPGCCSCDTIHMAISSDSIPFISSDTFAISVAKIFFKDSANTRVNVLNLSLESILPFVGKLNVDYNLNKTVVYNSYSIPKQTLDSNKPDFKIEFAAIGTEDSDSETTKGMTVSATINNDYENIEKIALQIMSQYNKTILKEHLVWFTIDITVESPSCKLCYSKQYHLFYDAMNHNM